MLGSSPIYRCCVQTGSQLFHGTLRTHASILLSLTFFLADALVLDDVLVIQCLQNVNLTGQIAALLLPVLGLQGLHCHQLASLISSRVVATQLHLTKVTLQEGDDRRWCL